MTNWIFFDEIVGVAEALRFTIALKANARERRLRKCAIEHVAWWEEQLHEQQTTE